MSPANEAENTARPDAWQHYVSACEWFRYEGQSFWNLTQSFLIAHAVFLGLLVEGAELKWQLQKYGACLMGLLLCFPWLVSSLRQAIYYEFRGAYARRCESKLRDIAILEDGKQLSSGNAATILTPEGNPDPYEMGGLTRLLRIRNSALIMMLIFATGYTAMAVSIALQHVPRSIWLVAFPCVVFVTLMCTWYNVERSRKKEE